MAPEEQRVVLPKISSVILRSFEVGDAEALAEIEYDPITKKFLGIPKPSKDEWIAKFKKGFAEWPSFAVVSMPEKILAGRASLHSSKELAPEKREIEIVIAKAFWGRGLGRSAAQALIPMAFHDFKATFVMGTVHPDNEPSIALLKGWQFRLVGRKIDGRLRYALSADDYTNSLK